METTLGPSVFCASVTPVDSDGRLDEAALRRHLRFLVSKGVGLCLGALNSGEGMLLRREEVRRLYEIGVEEVAGAVPVLAVSLGYTATEIIIDMAREAIDVGVSGVQLYPPRPGASSVVTLAEVDAFYRTILEAVEYPIYLGLQAGNMPDGKISIDLVEGLLADYPHIVGINCASPEDQLTAVTVAFRSRVAVRSGGSGQLLALLDAGGAGCLSGEANVAPTLVTSICAAHQRGDEEEARKLFETLRQLSSALRAFPVRCEKQAVHALWGHIGPHVRSPYLPLGREDSERLASTMDQLGIGQIEGV